MHVPTGKGRYDTIATGTFSKQLLRNTCSRPICSQGCPKRFGDLALIDCVLIRRWKDHLSPSVSPSSKVVIAGRLSVAFRRKLRQTLALLQRGKLTLSPGAYSRYEIGPDVCAALRGTICRRLSSSTRGHLLGRLRRKVEPAMPSQSTSASFRPKPLTSAVPHSVSCSRTTPTAPDNAELHDSG